MKTNNIYRLEDMLSDLDSQYQNGLISLQNLYYDKGSPTFNNPEWFEFAHKNLNQRYNDVRKDLIYQYRNT
jgi:hypothetical protein